MKDYLKVMWFAIATIVSIAILGFVANALGLASFAFFAPKVQQVQTNVFKEGQAYVDGMRMDFDDLMLRYRIAPTDQKAAIRAVMLQRFASFDINKLNPDQQQFYYQLKTE